MSAYSARDVWMRAWGFPLVAGALMVMLLASAFALYPRIAAAQSQQRLITSTQAAMLTVGELRADVSDANVAVEEYILTDNATDGQRYQAAHASASEAMRSLTTPVGVNAAASHDIAQLRPLAVATFSAMQQALALAQAGNRSQATQQLNTGSVGQTLRRWRATVAQAQTAENGVLRSQIRQAQDSEDLLLRISILTALLDVVALVAILLLLWHTLALREQFAQERARAEAQAHITALQETTRRMKDFLEVASHEMRTPLTSLKIALQLTARVVQRVAAAARQSDSQDGGQGSGATLANLALVAEPLERALVSTEQLERLVGDLLDSTRLEVSALEMRATTCDLGALVEDCVAEQRLYHPQRTINVTPPTEPLSVRADGERIRQVITNYLNNAHKFSEERHPIAVRLSADAGQAKVAVHDEGPGIPPEDQSRVWDQFYRAPGIGHVSGSSEGFGLGLYICASIIKQHGGAVGVESALGQGSTFWFTLPRIGAESAESAGSAESAQPRDASPSQEKRA